MPITPAHPLFPGYKRVAAMRPICTLAQIILVRSGRAMHARLERELWDAVQARNNPLIELKLDELEDLERRIRELPPALAREIAPVYRNRTRGSEQPRDNAAAPAGGNSDAEERSEASGEACEGAPAETSQVVKNAFGNFTTEAI